ncbi:reverse transcriptase domain-containing protein [Tanacetum coccineum]|uniref:Reverse transcriptase domain-containing protein n=1 Tax=Tanacetum coccineum TaxID=301880 RepID=A0ABQ5ICR0_9ASTR
MSDMTTCLNDLSYIPLNNEQNNPTQGDIEEAKRRNYRAKMKTFEESTKLQQYAVSNKEDTAYLRWLITRNAFLSIPYTALQGKLSLYAVSTYLDTAKSFSGNAVSNLQKRRIRPIDTAFEVYGLTKALEKANSVNGEIKGVTTRGEKPTIETTQDADITKKPPTPHNSKPAPPLKIPHEQEQKANTEKDTKPETSQLQLNIPFTEALAQMPKYAKFIKGLLSNKTRLEEACTVTMNQRCSAVLLNKLPLKEKDPGSFTILCEIGDLHIDNALADLGASISLMPYSRYEKLGLGEPKPTRMSLELADRSIQYPRGVAENVLIKVDKFILPIDFVILDMREDTRIPIILGRPFLVVNIKYTSKKESD